MRSLRLAAAALLLSSFSVAPAMAQTPDTGLIGVGGDIGVFFPDEAFETTLTLDAFGEYYVTPRISVRALLGWAKPGFENQTENNFRQTRLLFNGVYNWEMEEWHPYVTAGAGFYWVRQLFENLPDPDGETRGGINLGGGVEYFLDDNSSLKFEGRWDFVSDPPGLPDASGFTLTFGYKRYF